MLYSKYTKEVVL